MTRWLLAAGAIALLAGLLAWQWTRERQIAACEASGGAWDGPSSRCVKRPPTPILKRNLDRT